MTLLINLAALLLAFGVTGLGLRLMRWTGVERTDPIAVLALATSGGTAILTTVLFVFGLLGGLRTAWLWSLGVVLILQSIPELLRFWKERVRIGASGWNPGMPALLVAAPLGAAWLFARLPPVFFDTLVYHLGLPRQYLLHGGLVHMPNFHYSAMPGNVELLYAFGLGTGGIALARLIAFGGLVFGVLGIAALARHWRPDSGNLAGAIALGLPVTLFMGIHSGVDHWVAVFVVGTVLATLHWVRSGRNADALWAGILAGAAIGSKYTALYHLAPLAPLALLMRWRNAPLQSAVARQGAIALAAMLLVGGGWYARNVVNTGNPVYPAFYSILGGDGWSEAAAARVASDVAHGGAGQLTVGTVVRMPWNLVMQPNQFGQFGRVGPLFWIVLAAGAAGAARFSPVVLIWMALAVPLWMATSLNLRYLLPVLWVLAAGAGVAAAGWIGTGSGRWRRHAVHVLVLLIVGTGIEWITFYETTVFRAQDYLLGRLNTDEYLAQGLDYYRAARQSAALPEDARILLIGETRILYFDRPVVVSSGYDESILTAFIQRGGTVEGTVCAMQQDGITHLFYSPREATRFENQYDYFGGLGDAGVAVLVNLLGTAERVVTQDDVSLLALPEPAPACQPASAGTAGLQ